MLFRRLPVLLIFLLVQFFVFSCSQKKSTVENTNIPQSEKSSSVNEEKHDSSTGGSITGSLTQGGMRQLMVYYFMSNYRCPSCIYIEEATKTTVNEVFAEQLKTGRVAFQAINIDQAENQHFTNEYKLFSQSVILSDIKDGKEQRWANLEKIWQLLNNDKHFKEYIVKEIRKYLEG